MAHKNRWLCAMMPDRVAFSSAIKSSILMTVEQAPKKRAEMLKLRRPAHFNMSANMFSIAPARI
jgi:elongation factor P hydroxylase